MKRSTNNNAEDFSWLTMFSHYSQVVLARIKLNTAVHQGPRQHHHEALACGYTAPYTIWKHQIVAIS